MLYRLSGQYWLAIFSVPVTFLQPPPIVAVLPDRVELLTNIDPSPLYRPPPAPPAALCIAPLAPPASLPEKVLLLYLFKESGRA